MRAFSLAGENHRTSILRAIELLLLFSLCSIAVIHWIEFMQWHPDSSIYITTSINFTKTGQFFYFGNWPSLSTQPVVEPYTDWPPGFPLLLAPFIIIFKDPILSAVILQSLVIIGLYLFVYFFANSLDFHPGLRLFLYFIITFFTPFQFIRDCFLTETLFLLLSLAIGFCAIQLIRGKNKLKYYLASMFLLISVSLVKFIGVANLAWFVPLFIPAFYEKAKKWVSNRVIQRMLIFSGLGVLALFFFITFVLLHKETIFGNLRTMVFLAGLFLFLSGLLCIIFTDFKTWLHNEKFQKSLIICAIFLLIITFGSNFLPINLQLSLVQQILLLVLSLVMVFIGTYPRLLLKFQIKIDSKQNAIEDQLEWRWGVGLLLTAVLPVVFWLLHNQILYGLTTRSHNFFENLYLERAERPFRYLIAHILYLRVIPVQVFVIVLMIIVAIPFLFLIGNKKTIYHSILIAFVVHFLIIFLSYLVADFDPVGSFRLLSTSIFLAILTVTYALNAALTQFKNNKWVMYAVIALPFLFLVLSDQIVFPEIELNHIQINYPLEKRLWEQIQNLDCVSSSSHFYSNEDWIHEIYAGIPQRILENINSIKITSNVAEMIETGNHPFFLLSDGSEEAKILDGYVANGTFQMKVVSYPDLGFKLYCPLAN